jgi:hypothetical protein
VEAAAPVTVVDAAEPELVDPEPELVDPEPELVEPEVADDDVPLPPDVVPPDVVPPDVVPPDELPTGATAEDSPLADASDEVEVW